MKKIVHFVIVMMSLFFNLALANQFSNVNTDYQCDALADLLQSDLSADATKLFQAYNACGEVLFEEKQLVNVHDMIARTSNDQLIKLYQQFVDTNGGTLACANCHQRRLDTSVFASLKRFIPVVSTQEATDIIQLINPHANILDLMDSIISGKLNSVAPNLHDHEMRQAILHHGQDVYLKTVLAYQYLEWQDEQNFSLSTEATLVYMQNKIALEAPDAQGQCSACHTNNPLTVDTMLSNAQLDNTLLSNCSRCHVEEDRQDWGNPGDLLIDFSPFNPLYVSELD